MKTIQEHLREVDRKRILDALAYDLLCDPLTLLELQDHSIREIQNRYQEHMNQLIENLLSIEPLPSENMVFYMSESKWGGREFGNAKRDLCLVDINEIREDLDVPGYACDFTPWEQSLGYLVAENKLTQDYLSEVLAQYVKQVSFLGSTPDRRTERIDEIYADLEKSRKQIERGEYYTMEEVFQEMAEKHGIPVDEEDETQEMLERKIWKAEMELDRYMHHRERRRILESLNLPVPPQKTQASKDIETYTIHFCDIPGEFMSRVWIGPDPEKWIEFTGSYEGVAYEQWFDQYGKVVREKSCPEQNR